MSRKKLIVRTIVACFIAFTALIVYFTAIHRAESLLNQLVKSQSNGELLFKVEKVRLDILHLRFNFRAPELRTRDTSTTVTGYHIKAQNISFRAKSFIPFILGRRIVIDSVLISKPEIEVFKYIAGLKKKVSLPEEMSKVYQSLEVVLNVLNLNYLHIDSARFKVFDYVNQSNKPVEVSRLNLTVNKVTSEKRPSDNRFLFADRILLEVFNQDILFSDGFHGIKFKRFSLNTQSQSIKLDSCSIYGKQADSSYGEFSSFVDTVRISKLDLNLLVKNDILKMDSALCINPVVSFLIPLKGKQKINNIIDNDLLKKDSLDFVLKKMLGNLDIGYLTIKNANVKIVTKKGEQSKVYTTSNSNFSIEKFVINSDPDVPIKIERFNLDVRNYVGFSPDSLYVVKFDNIQIRNKTISLLNFRVGPTSTNQALLSRAITMEAFEFNDINWANLLYESRIVAGNVIMVKPELHFKLPGAKKSVADKENRKNPFSVLEEIRKKVQIDNILIRDGSISIEDLKETNFSIDHINAGLNVNQLLQSKNVYSVADALDNLSFSDGEYKNPSFQLLIKEGRYSKIDNTLRLSQIIRENTDHSLLAKMDNVNLKGIHINSSEKIMVDEFTWAKADLTMNTVVKREKKIIATEKPVSYFKFTISRLTGGPTMLNFRGKNIEASTQVTRISTDEIVIEGDQAPKISGLYIDGQSFTINQNKIKSSISNFNIQNKKLSTLNNVEIRLPAYKESITVFIPRLIFSADIYENINGIITADLIELQQPVISFVTRPAGSGRDTTKSGTRLPALNIRRLKIDQPKLANLPENLAAKMEIDPGRSSWNLLGLHTDGEIIKADSILISSSKPVFSNDKIRLISTGKELINLIGSDFRFNPGEPQSEINWSVKLDTLRSSGLQVNTLRDGTVSHIIAINTLNLENLILNNNVSNLGELIRKNDLFRLTHGNIVLENSKSRIETYNFTLDKSANSIYIDSMTFSPLDDKEAFMKTKKYQSNYMQLNTGLIKVNDINFDLLLDDAVINAKKLTINDLYFYDYKDKRLPFQHGIEKPLLSDLLQRITTKISFDSLLLKNAMFEYEEFNDKTQQYGKVKLSKIRGMVSGIRNYDFSLSDSIRFNLYARFMDAADLKLSYAQSYTDSLSEFQLKAIAGSFDLTNLNPMLKPFASVRVKRGYLDTIRMSVVGRKYVAYGVMKMYYHNLNVQYLNKGSKEKTLKSRLFTFFANRIVNKENLNGSGEVYAERDPEKGFVNYWVKIFIGGVITNTGVRTDKKQEKKYYQSIKKFNVPPIRDIPVDY